MGAIQCGLRDLTGVINTMPQEIKDKFQPYLNRAAKYSTWIEKLYGQVESKAK